jgi:hypothetical protein
VAIEISLNGVPVGGQSGGNSVLACNSIPYVFKLQAVTAGVLPMVGSVRVWDGEIGIGTPSQIFTDTINNIGDTIYSAPSGYVNGGIWSVEFLSITDALGCTIDLSNGAFNFQFDVREPITTEIIDTICLNGSYVFNGQNLSQSGTYTSSLIGFAGCDSVIVLHLHVVNPPAISVQPIDSISMTTGNTTSIRVTGTGIREYQWQKLEGGQWVNLVEGSQYSGVHTSELTISAIQTVGIFAFRVLVSGFSGCGFVISNSTALTVVSPARIPELITNSVTAITATSAVTGGVIDSDGGAPIIQKGVAYGVVPGPNRSNMVTSDGIGSGSFVSTLSNLLPSTVYYVRAYAENQVGTAYGNQKSFITLSSAVPGVSPTGVLGYVISPAYVRGNIQIGIPNSGWGFNINNVSAVGRLVMGRSAGGQIGGDSLACDTNLLNSAEMQGKIVVLYRGGCEIGVKALAAQRAGAIGVIIVNNNPGVINISGGGCGQQVTIPVVLIGSTDGSRLRNAIINDSTVVLIGKKRNSLDWDLGFSDSDITRPMEWSLPYSQSTFLGAYKAPLALRVTNFGKLEQTNVQANLRIDFSAENGQISTIYNNSVFIPVLHRDSSSVVTFPEFDPYQYGKGNYFLNFSVLSNRPDYYLPDNSNTQQFLVTENIYSKIRFGNTQEFLTQNNFRPPGGTGPFEYGIFMYSKTRNETKIERIKFTLNTVSGVSLANQVINGKVYQWADSNINGELESNEMLLRGQGSFIFDANGQGGQMREITISSLSQPGVGVSLDSGVYLISVQYNGNQQGVSMPLGSFIDYSSSGNDPFQHVSAYRTDGNWITNSPNRSSVPSILVYSAPVIQCSFEANYFSSDTISACASTFELDANTSLPLRWVNGQSNRFLQASTSGWYWIDVDSGGCRGRDSVYLDLFEIQIKPFDTTLCAGSALPLSVVSADGQPIQAPRLVDRFTIDFARPFTRTVFTTPGETYLMTISGTFALQCNHLNQNDAGFRYNHPDTLPVNHPFIRWNDLPIRPMPDEFNIAHNYVYSGLISNQLSQNFVFNDSSYEDNCGSLTFSIYLYNPKVEFLWSTGDTTSSVLLTPDSTTTIYCTVSNGISTCTDSMNAQIVPTPVSSFLITPAGATEFCQGGFVTLSAASPGALFYQWQRDFADIPGETNQNITVQHSGLYRLAAFSDSSSCPRYSNHIQVRVNPKTSANIEPLPRTIACFGDTHVLKAITDSGYTYAWRKNGVLLVNQNNHELLVTSPGMYELITSKAFHCSDTSDAVGLYFDYSAVIPTISVSRSRVCAGSPVFIQATGGANYIWSNGDTTSGILVFPFTTTTYGVRVISAGGCWAEDSIRIEVEQNPFPAVISAPFGDSVCRGDSVLLMVSRSGSVGNYIWSDGSTSDSIYVKSGGLVELRLQLPDMVCDGSIVDSIQIVEIRDSILVGNFLSVCFGDTVHLFASNFVSGQWSNGDTTGSLSIVPDSTMTIYVQYVSLFGCEVKDTVTIEVLPPVPPGPPANLLPSNNSYDLFSPINFTWSASVNATIYDLYLWVAGTERPSEPVLSNMGINITLEDVLLPRTEYYWQVAARNSCYTTFSDTMAFTYRTFPDLVVDSLEIPVSPFSGSLINITYRVRNIGGYSTGSTQWYDRIYLSTDLDLNKNDDIFLAAYDNLTYLDTGQSYLRNVALSLPRELLSTVYLFVVTDNEDAYLCNLPGRNCPDGVQNYSHNTGMPELLEDNNYAVKLLNIIPSPMPDLQVQSLGVPISAFSGDTIQLVNSIINGGQADVPLGSQWRNCYYLTRDSIFDSSRAIELSPLQYNAQFMSYPLSIGNASTRNLSVVLPDSLFGSFYLFAKCDCDNNVFEGSNESNNLGRAELSTHITLSPPPDLAITHISVPSAAVSPGLISLQYTVYNQGANPTRTNLWIDSIWLSPDSILQESDDIPLSGITYFGGNLPLYPGQYYIRNLNIQIPRGIEGRYFLFVKTDASNQIFEYTFENNNIDSRPIVLAVAPYADLVVQNVIPPQYDSLFADSVYNVSWVIKNEGQTYAPGPFFDQIKVMFPGTLTGTPVRVLQSVTFNDTLFPGDSILRTASFVSPNINGIFDIVVHTDATDTIFEYQSESNNYFGGMAAGTRKRFVPRPGGAGQPGLQTYFDFDVVDCTLPAFAISGQTLPVTFRVRNNGPVQNPGGWWNERVLLSTDSTFSSFVVTNSVHAGVIRVGNYYQKTINIAVPNGAFGNYYVRVEIDYDGRLTGDTIRSNNLRTVIVPVTLNQPADLSPITMSISSNNLFAGQQFWVPYTVRNAGSGGTGSTNIIDALYINNLPNLSNAIAIGSRAETRNIAPGNSYTDSILVALPPWASGNYYIIFFTDATNQVYEHLNEGNNYLITNRLIAPISASGSDLVVCSALSPDTLLLGEEYQVNYSITNTGQSVASGLLRDAFFIGSGPNYTANGEVLFNFRNHHIGISSGDTINYNLEGRMPGMNTGPYFGIVNTNINASVPEIDLSNNFLTSGPVVVDAHEIFPGRPDSGWIDQGKPLYYKVVPTADKDLIIRIDSDYPGNGINEVFVSHEAVPTTSNYEFRNPVTFGLDQYVLVPSTSSGQYFVLVNAQSQFSVQQNIRIHADTLGYQIISCSPNRLGRGLVTTIIRGAGFKPGIQFKLRNSSNQVVAVASVVQLSSSMEATVTWELTQVNSGEYKLFSINPDFSIAELSDTIFIEEASGYSMSGYSNAPDVIRFGRSATFSFTFENNGNIDIPFARTEISLPNDVEITSLNYSGDRTFGLDKFNVLVGSTVKKYFEVEDFKLIPVIVRGMRPGQQVTVNLTARSFNRALFPFTQRMQGYSVSNFLTIQLAMAELYRNALMNNPSAFPFSVVQIASDPVLYRDTLLSHLINVGLFGSEDTIGFSTICPNCPLNITHNPGSQVGVSVQNHFMLSSGDRLKWDISLPDGQPGNALGWDLIQVYGSANINYSGTPIRIDIASVSCHTELPSFLSGFEPWRHGKWAFIVATNGVQNFDQNSFEINSDEFTRYNNVYGGVFSLQISLTQDTVFIIFTPSAPGPGVQGFPGNPGHFGQKGGDGGPGGPGTCNIPPGRGGDGGAGGEGVAGMSAGVGGNGGQGGVSTCVNIPGGIGGAGGPGGRGYLGQSGANGGRGGMGGSGIPSSTGSNGGMGGNGGSGGEGGSCTLSGIAGSGGIGGSGGQGGNGYGPAGMGGIGGNGGNGGRGGVGSGVPGFGGMGGSGGRSLNPAGANGMSGASGLIGNFGTALAPGTTCAPDPNMIVVPQPIPCNTPQTNSRVLCSEFTESILRGIDCDSSISHCVENAMSAMLSGSQSSVSGFGSLMFSGLECGMGMFSCNNGGTEYASAISCIPDLLDLRNPNITNPLLSPYCSRFMLCKEVPVITACDPNEILGPPGFGPEKFIARKDTLHYTVFFENDPLFATTSAQTVNIRVPVDIDLNPLSLRVREFGFGRYTFEIPGQRSSFSMTLPLQDDPEVGVDVQVSGGIDVVSNEIFVVFQSVNRNTGLPPSDPRAGFLKINDSTGKGEGFVRYSIVPKNSAETGDSVLAQAEILFDINTTIKTNVAFNTIDALEPVTSLDSLGYFQDSTFVELKYLNNDDFGGSGVSYINLYASRSMEPYRLITILNPLDSVYVFSGMGNSQYSFVLQGVDHVGNIEEFKSVPDLTIFLRTSSLFVNQPVQAAHFCSGDVIPISWIQKNLTGFTIAYSSDSGGNYETIATNVDSSNNPYYWTIPTSLAGGNYHIRVTTTDGLISATSQYFAISALPDIGLPIEISLCEGDSAQINATGGVRYTWEPNLGLSSDTVSNPTLRPMFSTRYFVTVVTSQGCTARDSVWVRVGLRDTVRIVTNTCDVITAGIDTIVEQNMSGCDSTSIVTRIYRPSFLDTIQISGNCVGDTLLLGNLLITTSGLYEDRLTSVFGCDSVRIYNVSYYVGNTNQNFYDICFGDSILINNQWIKDEGVYQTVFSSSGLCDSVVISTVRLKNCSRVSGVLNYDNSALSPVRNATLRLVNDSGILVATVTTDSLGRYSFVSQPIGSYRIELEDRPIWGGVNATDAVIIQNRVTGIAALNALRNLAADVNSSGTINSADALITTRRVAGFINSFIAGNWAFIPPPIEITFSDLERNLRTTCVGDVNSSYNPNFQARSSYQRIHSTIDVNNFRDKGVPIFLDESLLIGAITLTLNLPPGLIVANLELPTDANPEQLQYKQEGSLLKVAWFSVYGWEYQKTSPFMVLHFEEDQEKIKKAVSENGIWYLPNECELADPLGNVIPIWSMNLPKFNHDDLKRNYQLYPNPTTGVLYFEGLAESIVIRDLIGNKLMAITPEMGSVYPIDLSAFSDGVYTLTITSNGGISNEKIVIRR